MNLLEWQEVFYFLMMWRNGLKNHKGLEAVALGSFEFKNVEEPMEVFALANDGLMIPKRNEIKGKLKQKKPHLLPWLIGSLLFLFKT